MMVGFTPRNAKSKSALGPAEELKTMEACENSAARVTVSGNMRVRDSRDRTRSCSSRR